MADFGGIVASALQGGAEVVGRQAQDALADQRKLDITKQISQMDEEKQMRIAEATANLRLKTDQTSRENERDFSVDPKTLDAAGKVADSKNQHAIYHTKLGDQIRDAKGNLVAENTGLTSAEARAQGSGTGKVDHYDDKAWDQFSKADPALVSFQDPITQKAREVPELRNIYLSEYNKLRASGASSPSLASEQARNTVIKLRNAAEDLASSDEGKRLNMTPEMATKQLLKEYEAARRGPAAGAAPAPAKTDGIVDAVRKKIPDTSKSTPMSFPLTDIRKSERERAMKATREEEMVHKTRP